MSDESQLHHIRRQVRDYIVQLLTNGVPPALIPGGVLKSRVKSLSAGELPAIIVYTVSEEASRSGDSEDRDRTILVAIDIRVADNDDLDDALDGIAVPVEKVLDGDPFLGGLALQPVDLRSTAIGLMGGENVITNGSAVLTSAVQVRTPIGMPEGEP